MTVSLSTAPLRRRRLRLAAAVAATIGVTLTGCAGAPESRTQETESTAAFPVRITSCGHTSTLTAPPTHAVTLNQGATEVMLALGLQDEMAGTAYLDDQVPSKWEAAYKSVPVLAKEYPSPETLLAAQPDFVYASYSSAFDPKVAGTPTELDSEHIASYVSPFGCEDKAQRPATSFDAVWNEVAAVALAFGVPERATELRDKQQQTLDGLGATAAGKGVKVLWYDSGTKTPLIGAGHGGPQLILDSVGATNIFAGLDGSWVDGNWEDVLAADPDVIVLADASWDTAADKQAYLEGDPVLSQLRAVKEGRFVTVPFSESTAGVRLLDGAQTVSDQLAKLALGQ
jgi:iron complex transport system substrate-binding protein